MSSLHRFSLAGRTAIVAGGAPGMGWATAELAASTGAAMTILDVLGVETPCTVRHREAT